MEKARLAGKSPQMVKLKKDEEKYWCACGMSDTQPWCNGAHQKSSFNPVAFTMDTDKEVAICLCKQTSNPPFCDGTHLKFS
jgi:CDGSH-type Zn-finger protein